MKTYDKPPTLNDLKPGDVIKIDGGFTCAGEGYRVVKKDSHGLYFQCRDGQHYLDGQENEDGSLVGISWPKNTGRAHALFVDVAGELFNPHGPITGSMEWQATWEAADEVYKRCLKEAEQEVKRSRGRARSVIWRKDGQGNN